MKVELHYVRVDMVVSAQVDLKEHEEKAELYGYTFVTNDYNMYWDSKLNKPRKTKIDNNKCSFSLRSLYAVKDGKAVSLCTIPIDKPIHESVKALESRLSKEHILKSLADMFCSDARQKCVEKHKEDRAKKDKEYSEKREQAVLKEEREAKELKELRDKEDATFHGFLSGVNPMRRQRVIDTLAKLIRAQGKVRTKKRFIEELWHEGREAKQYDDVQHWKKGGKGLSKAKTEYRIENNDGVFYEVNKTCFDYFNHIATKFVVV